MKKVAPLTRFYFVDESGDPTFYDARGNLILGKDSATGGCSRYLMLGFIQTDEPGVVREGIAKLHAELCADPYFKSSPPFLKSTIRGFHAKNDPPEVRREVLRLIKALPIRAECIFARKREATFRNSFGGKEAAFYDHLVTRLFERKLHLAAENRIYFATRGTRNRQKPLEMAVNKSVERFRAKYPHAPSTSCLVHCQSPIGEPCLQVVDYVLWAVQRVFTRKESRFFDSISDKVDLVWDLYDIDKYREGGKNIFTKSNLLHPDKVTAL